MKKLRLSILAVAFVPAFGATVLFDHPLVNGSDGGLFSNDPTQLAADAFSIAGGGLITEASWYGAAISHLPLSAFNVEFYASNAGSPGVQLAKFTGAATAIDQGFVDSYNAEVFQFTMSFSGFTAAPGVTYFFSVSDSGPSNFVWASSNASSGGFFSNNGAAGPWNVISEPARATQAFSLLATSTASIPEPGSASFILAGVFLLGIVQIRQRCRTL